MPLLVHVEARTPRAKSRNGEMGYLTLRPEESGKGEGPADFSPSPSDRYEAFTREALSTLPNGGSGRILRVEDGFACCGSLVAQREQGRLGLEWVCALWSGAPDLSPEERLALQEILQEAFQEFQDLVTSRTDWIARSNVAQDPALAIWRREIHEFLEGRWAARAAEEKRRQSEERARLQEQRSRFEAARRGVAQALQALTRGLPHLEETEFEMALRTFGVEVEDLAKQAPPSHEAEMRACVEDAKKTAQKHVRHEVDSRRWRVLRRRFGGALRGAASRAGNLFFALKRKPERQTPSNPKGRRGAWILPLLFLTLCGGLAFLLWNPSRLGRSVGASAEATALAEETARHCRSFAAFRPEEIARDLEARLSAEIPEIAQALGSGAQLRILSGVSEAPGGVRLYDPASPRWNCALRLRLAETSGRMLRLEAAFAPAFDAFSPEVRAAFEAASAPPPSPFLSPDDLEALSGLRGEGLRFVLQALDPDDPQEPKNFLEATDFLGSHPSLRSSFLNGAHPRQAAEFRALVHEPFSAEAEAANLRLDLLRSAQTLRLLIAQTER